MSLSINFFHRKGTYPDSKTSLYCRISKDGKLAEYKTSIKIIHALWDEKAQRVKGVSDDAFITNRIISEITNKIYSIVAELERTETKITPKRIKYELDGGERYDRKNSLINFYKKEIERKKSSGYAESSIKKSQVSLNNLRFFLETIYRVEDMLVVDIDYKFIKNFEEWSYTEGVFDGVVKRRWKNNYYIGELSTIKKITTEAFKMGLIKSHPFVGYTTKKTAAHYRYLTQEEVEIIENLDLSGIEDGLVSLVRDLFVFSCYTGLAYVDLKNLTYNQILNHPLIGLCINKKRHKTQVEAFIPLLSKSKKIYEKRKGDGPHIFSVPSYNAYRDSLIEIQKRAKLAKDIRSHVGRHTAATYFLNSGIPEESVCRALGLSSVSVLRTTYGKLLNETVAKHFKLLETA
jgi:integrase